MSQEEGGDKDEGLLPCPCCGSAAAFEHVEDEEDVNNFGGEYVECQNRQCGVTTRLVFPLKGEVKGELREVWNRRASLSSVAGSEEAALAYKEFWDRHAKGSMLCPSCLMCGAACAREQWAIRHAELPDIYICACCVEKVRNPIDTAVSATAALQAIKNRPCSKPDATGGACDCCAHHWWAIDGGEYVSPRPCSCGAEIGKYHATGCGYEGIFNG